MNKTTRMVWFSCLGSGLEYYDFVIYATMIPYITPIFFVDHQPMLASLKSFSILAVGYLARPLGGYLFGVISDIYGRKKGFLLIMSIMAAATLVMGLLPTYAQIGVWAPLLLMFARILQGLSFGAEMPSVSTLIQEQGAEKRSGHYFGWIISSTSIGALLASFVVFLMGRTLSAERIAQGLWRAPFILGGLLALLAFYLRSRIQESDDFLNHQEQRTLHQSGKTILLLLFKQHPRALIRGFCVTIFFSYLIIFGFFLSVYLGGYMHYQTPDIFFNISMGMLAAGLIAPMAGRLLDRINRIRAIQITALFFLVFFYVGLQALKAHVPYALMGFLLCYQLIIGFYSTNVLGILPSLFPLPLRATGMGLSYNLAYSTASLIPLALSACLARYADFHLAVIWGCGALVVSITFIGTLCTEPKRLLQPNTHGSAAANAAVL